MYSPADLLLAKDNGDNLIRLLLFDYCLVLHLFGSDSMFDAQKLVG